MRGLFRSLLQIKNSFLIVLVLILSLIIALSFLLTRLALANVDASEAAKRNNVRTFVTNSFAQAVRGMQPAVVAISADKALLSPWAAGDRAALLAAATPLYERLRTIADVKQMQFNGADLHVFLRAHNPSVFGDDLTTSRPAVVDCLTHKQAVAGLEQGKSGYGFRALTPVFTGQQMLGCVELGSDLNTGFLESLNANYPGSWAIVNLARSAAIGRDRPVLATLNEPPDSPLFLPDFQTPAPIVSAMIQNQMVDRYSAADNTMTVYIPVQNYRGEVALYVRYSSPTPYYRTIASMVMEATIISVVGLALTGIAFGLLYRGIRGPVQLLVRETEKIKNFELADDVHIGASLVELQKLIAAVADMKVGLRSFQKYVPSNLVRQLIATKQEARIGGKLQELTVFFSDIVDFTAITEDLSPNELAQLLSEYFTVMTATIGHQLGTVDKYIGDAVMAFWGAPVDLEDHALRACRAALECRRQIDALGQAWRLKGRLAFATRFGIATGEMVVGNVGSDHRLNYSVIGDAVNLASRLEGLNKVYGTGIIINEDCYNACAEFIEARAIDLVQVKGKREPVRIYELIGERGDISPRRKESLKLFDRAQAAYLDADLSRAHELFTNLHARDPEDTVVSLYLKRCADFIAEPPPKGWKGLATYTTK